MVPESPLKRQTQIAKCIGEFLLQDVADIIGSYDYYLEEVNSKTLDVNVINVLSDGRILCYQSSSDYIKILDIDSNNYDIMSNNNHDIISRNFSSQCYLELPDDLIAIGSVSGIIFIYYIGESVENTVYKIIDGEKHRLPFMNLCLNESEGQHGYCGLNWIEYISDDLIVSAGDKLIIWNIGHQNTLKQKNVKPYMVLEEHSINHIVAVSVIDHQKFACVYNDSRIKIWNTITGSCDSILQNDENVYDYQILNVVFYNHMICLSYEKYIQVWDLDKKSSMGIKNCYPVIHNCKRLKLSKIKSNIFTERKFHVRPFNDDNVINLLDCEKLQPIITNINILVREYDPDDRVRPTFLILPDNTIIGSDNGKIKKWDFDENESNIFQECENLQFWLLPDGRYISESFDGLKVWH